MKVSWDYYSEYIYRKKKFQSTNQLWLYPNQFLLVALRLMLHVEQHTFFTPPATAPRDPAVGISITVGPTGAMWGHHCEALFLCN